MPPLPRRQTWYGRSAPSEFETNSRAESTTRVGKLATLTARLNFALNVTPQVFIGLGMLVLLGTFAVAAQFSSGSFATLGGTALLLFRALTFGQQISGIQQRTQQGDSVYVGD